MPIKDNKHGVYLIVCNATHKYYIGSSNNMRSRRYKHFGDLRKSIHRIKEMQDDFNQYGESAFSYYVLEELIRDKKIQLERENFYINQYKVQLYNLSPNATRKGYKEPKEVRDKMSLSRRGQNNANYKYKKEDFELAKEYLLEGNTTRDVAELTGMSWALIKDFRNGKCWINEELGGSYKDWLKDVDVHGS